MPLIPFWSGVKIKVTEQANSTTNIIKAIRFIGRSPLTDKNLLFSM
jgi:hypothetical protein